MATSMTESSQRYQSIRIRVAQSSLDRTGKMARRDPDKALRQAQRLIDDELKRLPLADRGPVACRPGCDFCCHLRVMATPIEVFALLDYLGHTLERDALEAMEERIRTTDRALRKLASDKVVKTNLPCPVLVDGQCSAYPARPLNCRSYHSLSREACEASFNHPEDLDRGHPQLTAVAKVHEGGQAGFIEAFAQAGRDSNQYELVTAMAEALADPEARDRYAHGQQAFVRPSILAGF